MRKSRLNCGRRQALAAPLAAVASVVWLGATCEPAFAEAAPQSREAGAGDSSSGGNIAKGIVGGGMLGAEIVMLAESAFRLRPTWMYLAGAGAGALAGGYLGYSISDDSSNKPPAFLLAGGIALIIPTIMGVLTATQYAPPDSPRESPDEDQPEEDQDDDSSADDSPADESPTEEPPAETELPEERSSLAVRFQLPNVGLAQAFSRDELARFRIHQVTELHLSLVRGSF